MNYTILFGQMSLADEAGACLHMKRGGRLITFLHLFRSERLYECLVGVNESFFVISKLFNQFLHITIGELVSGSRKGLKPDKRMIS